MVSAGYSEESGLQSYLVVNAGSSVETEEIIARLNDAEPEDSVDEVLGHSGFTVLEPEASRAALESAVERLVAGTAWVWDLVTEDRAH
jgi:hypothetical protein